MNLITKLFILAFFVASAAGCKTSRFGSIEIPEHLQAANCSNASARLQTEVTAVIINRSEVEISCSTESSQSANDQSTGQNNPNQNDSSKKEICTIAKRYLSAKSDIKVPPDSVICGIGYSISGGLSGRDFASLSIESEFLFVSKSQKPVSPSIKGFASESNSLELDPVRTSPALCAFSVNCGLFARGNATSASAKEEEVTPYSKLLHQHLGAKLVLYWQGFPSVDLAPLKATLKIQYLSN